MKKPDENSVVVVWYVPKGCVLHRLMPKQRGWYGFKLWLSAARERFWWWFDRRQHDAENGP